MNRAQVRSLPLFVLVAALVVTGLALRLNAKLNFTGDEPRYLLQALSFAIDGVPLMPEAHYEKFRETHQKSGVAAYPFREIIPVVPEKSWMPYHAVIVSLVLAPVSAIWSLEHVRLIPFAIGVTGLCFLARMLAKQTTNAFSALACFIPAALCFPALPYQFLAVPEIFLFTLSSVVVWNLTSASTGKISGYLPAIICSSLAPFVHLRGLTLFGATAAWLALGLFRTKDRRSWRRILIFITLFLAILAAAFVANSIVHGNSLVRLRDRPVWTTRSFEDMFVHYRHGLFAYAPVWLLSFSGLAVALRVRKSWAIPALIFLLALVAGSAKGIGEAYPGRFWVQAVPILALCLSGFTEADLSRAIKLSIYLPLLGLSLANSAIFFVSPDLHLAARSGAYPYDRLFEIFPAMNFGFWLDVIDSSFVRIGAICFCLIAILLAAFAAMFRSTVLNVTAIVVLLVGFEAHRVRGIPVTTTAEPNAVVVRLPEHFDVALLPIRVRLQAPWKRVGPRKDESTRPIIEVADGDRNWRTPIMSGSVLCHKSSARPAEFFVRLSWTSIDPAAVDPAAPEREIQALASNSWLARLW